MPPLPPSEGETHCFLPLRAERGLGEVVSPTGESGGGRTTPLLGQAVLSLMIWGMLMRRTARRPGTWLIKATAMIASEAQTNVIGFT